MSEAEKLIKQFQDGLQKEITCTVTSQPVRRYCIMGRITFIGFISSVQLLYGNILLTRHWKHPEPVVIPWKLFEFQNVTIVPSNSIEEGMFFGSESIE